AVRRKPYSVLLLDEVEKAHADVFNILLQVLEDGRLTDGQGRTVDFRNTVIVMTSNMGSDIIQRMGGEDSGDSEKDYEHMKEMVMAVVGDHFRPELINRIDEVVVFHALGQEQIQAIASIQLDRLRARLAEHELSLQVSDDALAQLAVVGFDPVFGARPLKRAIQSRIENPLAQDLLAGKFAPGDTIKVASQDGKLVFSKE
ncbi:MAG: AAA family ATPase, partial [Onishia taeanensis]|uniref:AAA family ATPase n=1 Tax=Onishia taeanensis TaxID=284577 RepID=UPI003C79E2F3